MATLDFRLLNEFQRGFPLVAQPFVEIAARLGTDEETVLAMLRRLQAAGVVGRVGAVFAPGRVGVSTLAALAAPPEKLEDIAARVSRRPEVNHNYAREHAYNLWFVVTARDAAHLAGVLAEIEQDSGCRVISLPLEQEYYIDLGFDLAGAGKTPGTGESIVADAPCRLSTADERLIGVLQQGLELVSRPFARLSVQSGMQEQEVIATLHRWCDDGLIKRFGVVVRHHELGYAANAMVVWDVPDTGAERTGRLLAAEPMVTLCYRRRRHLPEWPYNLYCMIHGRERSSVERIIESLRRLPGLDGQPCAVLFSRYRFKQQGARYISEAAAHG